MDQYECLNEYLDPDDFDSPCDCPDCRDRDELDAAIEDAAASGSITDEEARWMHLATGC